MTLIERYVFKTTLTAVFTGLGVLTLMIWLTQSLRQFDLLTTKGQSFWTFLTITGLSVPSLIIVIAPVALFIGILYSLNKLNSDSELIVMSASGLSPARLLRPFALMIVLISLLVASMSLYIMPWSFRTLRDLITQVRSDFLTRVVQPGSFSDLDAGFTFHYRERGPGGELLGVFMQDRREIGHVSTYLAERGQTLSTDDSSYLMLDKGSIQRQQPNSRDAAIIVFDRYGIDLGQFGSDAGDTSYKPRERSTGELLALDEKDPKLKQQFGKFRSELQDRLVNPLYALTFGLVAFAALGQARTTRQGRGMAIVTAIVIILLDRILGFVASGYVARSARWIPVVYVVPLSVFAGSLWALFGPSIDIKPRLRRFVPRFKPA